VLSGNSAVAGKAFPWLPGPKTKAEAVVAVGLPDGSVGYLLKTDVRMADSIVPDPVEMVRQGEQFLGLNYVWAGTSAYGFDCSGLTMRLLQSQGVDIPRDAADQAMEGMAVEKSSLAIGDLLFYANNAGKGYVYHVGMYVGDGMMIHAPNSKSQVQTVSISSGSYGKDYFGARRYIK
jgi:cell wall-associated NlpC family hydrolase